LKAVVTLFFWAKQEALVKNEKIYTFDFLWYRLAS
jgi:hypothetical protein